MRLGKTRVKAILREIGRVHDVEAEPAQAGRTDQDEQRLDRLDASRQIP